MARDGYCIVDLPTYRSAQRSGCCVHRNRTWVDASLPTILQRVGRVFLAAIAVSIQYGFAIVLSVACLLCR
jgi:hypothetical protein